MPYSAPAKDLMSALISKLYHIITGDDPEIKYPNSKYITWIMPGIPFTPEDFTFCEKGFIGSNAEEINRLANQAFVLSKLFDFIPDPSGLVMDHKMQQSIFASTQDTISSVYGDVLQFSKVINRELSEEQQKLIDEKMAFIASKEDIYNKYWDEYLKEIAAYNKAKSEAQNATGSDPASKAAAAYWIDMGPILKEKVGHAEGNFESLGFKKQIETAQAYIEQITANNMVSYKKRLTDNFEPKDSSFGKFFVTTLIPGNFAKSSGWMEFSFSEKDYNEYHNKSISKGNLGGGAKFLGLFKIGAGNGSTSTEETDDSKMSSNFTATFEFTQVPIVRPWFEPGFFSMRGWDLGEMWNLNWDKKVSNGEDPPLGRLVAYPTSALFVRKVTLSFDEASDFSHYFNSESSGSGAAAWGIFRANGSFSSSHEPKKVEHKFEDGKLIIEGMQLIGFINNLIPKSPNLHPNIKPEELVGGDTNSDGSTPV